MLLVRYVTNDKQMKTAPWLVTIPHENGEGVAFGVVVPYREPDIDVVADIIARLAYCREYRVRYSKQLLDYLHKMTPNVKKVLKKHDLLPTPSHYMTEVPAELTKYRQYLIKNRYTKEEANIVCSEIAEVLEELQYNGLFEERRTKVIARHAHELQSGLKELRFQNFASWIKSQSLRFCLWMENVSLYADSMISSDDAPQMEEPDEE